MVLVNIYLCKHNAYVYTRGIIADAAWADNTKPLRATVRSLVRQFVCQF